jgi:phage repressor protein C with HTH and peptisase S24 domain
MKDYNWLAATLQNLTGIKISQQTVANALNVRQSTIGSRATSGKEFAIGELMQIERAMNLPIGSLSGIQTNDNNIELDFFPDVFGSCGDGSMVFEETSEKLAVTKDVITNYSDKNKYSVIVARGQSNEPTIMNNDKLIIQHITNNLIIDNQLYVFSYDGQIYIKRLIKNIDEIVIISDNPDKSVYRNQYVSKENMNDLKILGKVVGLFRSKV